MLKQCGVLQAGPRKHRLRPQLSVCISLGVVSQNCLMFCWECLQLKVSDPRKYTFPSQHFIWYLYWKFHCVRLKLTMNFSLDCFQKLFKNSLDNKNCNCQTIPCFSMTRISFFFLIRQDDICQLPITGTEGAERLQRHSFY